MVLNDAPDIAVCKTTSAVFHLQTAALTVRSDDAQPASLPDPHYIVTAFEEHVDVIIGNGCAICGRKHACLATLSGWNNDDARPIRGNPKLAVEA